MQPEIVVQLDGRWIELPVRGEETPDTWAPRAVAAGLAARGVVETAAVERLYVQTWAELLRNLRRRSSDDGSAMVAAYGFVPSADLLPVTTTEVHVATLEGHTIERFVDDLVLPDADRFGPPDVLEVATAAGEATRLKQLVIAAGEDGAPVVHTNLLHVWSGPQPDSVLLMTSFFASPVDAELCLEAVDQLALTLTIVDGT